MINFADDPVGVMIKAINENYPDVDILIIKKSMPNSNVRIALKQNDAKVVGANIILPSDTSLISARDHIISTASHIITNTVDMTTEWKAKCDELYQLYLEYSESGYKKAGLA